MAVTLLTADELLARCRPMLSMLGDVFQPGDLDVLANDAVNASLSAFERRLETSFQQKRYAQLPDSAMVKGTHYDETEPALPFDTADWRNSIPDITLRRRPVVSIQRVRLAVDRDRPVGEILPEWFRLSPNIGKVSFVPLGTMALAMTGWPVYIVEAFSRGIGHPVIPHFLAIDYTAGWIAPTDTELPGPLWDLKDVLAGDAQGRFLLAVRDAIPNSLNLDGFSQQMDSVEQRLERLKARTEEFIAQWKRHYGPPIVSII